MKQLIYKDSQKESELNQQLASGIEAVNDVLAKYEATSLKPLTDKQQLTNFLNDPVRWVSDMVQKSANLGGWNVKPQKMVELLDEPAVTALIAQAKTLPAQELHLAMLNCKLAKNRLAVDSGKWQSFIDENCCTYATTTEELKALEMLKRLLDSLNELNRSGIKKQILVYNLDTLISYRGEGNDLAINLHGLRTLANR